MAVIRLTRADSIPSDANKSVQVESDAIKSIHNADHGATIKLGSMNFLRVSEKRDQIQAIINKAKQQP